MPRELPILDLSSFLVPTTSPDAKRRAARALDEACRTHGFFYLQAHGIPADLESRVLSLARQFFLSTPQEKKTAIARRDPGAGGDGARGYQRLGENVTQGASDYHEAVDFYRPVEDEELFDGADPVKGYKLLRGPNLWPEIEGFREAFEDFWRRLIALGDAVMRAMAWALGYEEDEEVISRVTDKAFWVARVIGYPPLQSRREGMGEGVSCGVHTDYGCTTFLLADETPGSLQVLGKDGEWINADPIKGGPLPTFFS
jgi:isopenicillin N synthase-like dioxygenase